MITLMVVEDDPAYRQNLLLILKEEADFQVLAQASDGNQAVRLAGLHLPNIILMDIGLSGLNGIDATRQIRLAYPSVNVLILTVFDDDERVFEAVKAGARGYLLKGYCARELPEAVREISAGRSLVHPMIARKVLDEFQRLSIEKSRSRAIDEDLFLSEREKQVLQYLGEGKKIPRVAELLGISPSTVRSYVDRILEKLEVSNKAQAIMVAAKRGLIGKASG